MSGIGQLSDALCDALATFDPAGWSGAECAELAERLARAAKACETASARGAARAAECGVVRAGDWLARLSGSTPAAARAALATVGQLDACPATRDALVAGEVSLGQAAQIVSVPSAEAELLDLARLGPVRDRARRRRLAAIDPGELYAQQRAARAFGWWTDDMGMVRLRGGLAPDVGMPIVHRLDEQTDRAWRAARKAGRSEPRAALAADAFVQLFGGTGTSKSADVVIVADLNAFRRGHGKAGEVCHIVGGGPIPVPVARELAKDAFLKAVLHDGVNIHRVKHFGRHIPAVLRTALEFGPAPDFDGVTCARAGCDRQHGPQWDHIDPRANGGPVSFENMDPLCLPDHIEKTERDRKAGLLANKKERGP